jgi:hypothetical protein
MMWLSKFNIVALVFYIATHLFLPDNISVTRIIHDLIQIFVIFIVPGFNLVAILQYFLKKQLSLNEIFTLSVASSLLVIPFILTLEYSKLGILFTTLPILNAVFIFFLTEFFLTLALIKKKGGHSSLILTMPFEKQHLTEFFLSKELVFSFLFYGLIVLGITISYYHLPDSDPYYWVSKYRILFESGNLTPLSGDRPLFSALSYIFNIGIGIDLYAIFKYILPAFLILLIIPAKLLSKEFPLSLQKVLIFLFPFVNGITLIYLTLPVPQALANIALFFFFTFLAYSWTSKNSFFFLVAGVTAFLGYFYHEVLALPFLTWCLVACYSYRKEIYRKTIENPVTVALLLLLILPILQGPWSFLVLRIQSSLLTSLANIHPNLLFPQYYVNVDGNQMGWETLMGITKYYLFYIGPALFLIFSAFIFSQKNALKKQVLLCKEGLVFSLSFTIFFSLAEIFPRVTGLAFLPDRAWVLAGPLALFLAIVLFRLPLGRRQFFLFVLIAGFLLNIGAALYINALKKYTFSDGQFAATEWIRQSLPENRVLFSVDNLYPLKLFSDSQVVLMNSPNFYYDIEFFNMQFQEQKNKRQNLDNLSEKKLSEIKQSISEISKKDLTRKNAPTILEKVDQSIEELKNISAELRNQTKEKNKKFYVYYAGPNPKNPYLGRPYLTILPGKENEMIFNKFPDQFKKVYSDEKEKIFIWEIL